MAQPLHRLKVCALDFLGRLLRHLGCGAPVELTRQEIDWAFLDVDLSNAVARVEAAEIEVQVAVEDAVRLAGVHVLDCSRSVMV